MKENRYGIHLSSPYISGKTEECWRKILEEFDFKNNAIETTVQNYGSTISLICNYFKKDFLDITSEDAEVYFAYLDERITLEKNRLSPRTVHTYKKNLNSVGKHFEEILRKPDGTSGFINPFHKKIGKTIAVKNAEKEFKRQKLKYQVVPEDVLRLLQSVKEKENIQYYFILCMIAFCGIESHAICEMRPEQIVIDMVDNRLVAGIRIPVKKMEPKTKPLEKKSEKMESNVKMESKETVQSNTKINYEIFTLPPGYQEEWQEYLLLNLKQIQEREFVFYNRNHNPVTFKTISSVLKKHKELMNISYPLTTKELCGSVVL